MIGLLDLTALSPPFDLTTVVGVVEPTATFLEALRTRLLDTPGLESLAEIYLTTAPPSAAFPFLVVDSIGDDAFINTSDSYYEESVYQFTVYSRDDYEAKQLRDAAYLALLPRESNPPLRFVEGYEMTRMPGRRRGPTSQEWGRVGGDPVWAAMFDYAWLIGRD